MGNNRLKYLQIDMMEFSVMQVLVHEHYFSMWIKLVQFKRLKNRIVRFQPELSSKLDREIKLPTKFTVNIRINDLTEI